MVTHMSVKLREKARGAKGDAHGRAPSAFCLLRSSFAPHCWAGWAPARRCWAACALWGSASRRLCPHPTRCAPPRARRLDTLCACRWQTPRLTWPARPWWRSCCGLAGTRRQNYAAPWPPPRRRASYSVSSAPAWPWRAMPGLPGILSAAAEALLVLGLSYLLVGFFARAPAGRNASGRRGARPRFASPLWRCWPA